MALHHWLDRVVDIRARELVVQQERDIKVVTLAFEKWLTLCARHGEDLSLVESFVDVKREGESRRSKNLRTA